ncbi:hypothetical protein HAX54_010099 [Datura stramonium]|uniref:Uncharacterized protein n=1 Tax=Datura stramonium TaxID=4076 RepID=A0ABS8THJ7_DATST|nr:hypothetical protein [Datura stramonium]
MVDEVDGPIALLEYTSPNKESFTAFNKERDGGVQEEDMGVHCDEPDAGPTTKLNSTEIRNDVGSNDVAAGTSNAVGPNDIAGIVATVVAPSRGRGRPRKATTEAPARGRGRPRQATSTSKAAESPARGRGRPTKDFSTSEAAEVPARGKGRQPKDSSAIEAAEASSRGRGRPRRTYNTSEWFENPTSYSAPVAPAAAQSNIVTGGPPILSIAHVDQSYMEKERTTPYKMPKTVGMGVFVAEDGFTTYNHGLPRSRILHSSARQLIRSAEVTRDLGFKPRTGVR